MKQAILIIAHKNFDYLERLIGTFDQDFEIYIHINKKIKIPPNVHDRLTAYPQVKRIIQKYKIHWGDLQILKSTLLLCQEALKSKDIEYLHIISGTDYPIKNKTFFKAFFEQNRHKEFLENFCLPTSCWEGGGLNRLEYFYPNYFINVRTPKGFKFSNRILDWQKRLHIKRKITFHHPLYGGSNWWSLSRECVSYVIDYTQNHYRFLKRFRFTFAPEEMYFQTVILNSGFASSVVNDNLRYIIWKYKNGNIPANLDMEDLNSLLLSSKVFARKIEFPYASDLIKKLQKIHSTALLVPSLPEVFDKKELLQYIADYLYNHATENTFKGLYYGIAGIAVFLFHYSGYTSEPRYADKGYELLSQLIEDIESITSLDYSEGILGIATAIEYLHIYHFISENTNEILEEIDQKVIQLLETKDTTYLQKLNITLRLDKYIELRIQNLSPENRLNESWIKQQYIPRSGIILWNISSCKCHPEDYLRQLRLTYGMGIIRGSAGIGLQILADLTQNSSWSSLF